MYHGGRKRQASRPWLYTYVLSLWALLWVPASQLGPAWGGRRDLPQVTKLVCFCLQTLLSHPLCAGSAPAGQTSGDQGPRLSHLSVTDVTTSSLRLNWEAPPGAFDSFLLRYGVPSPSTLEPHPRPLLQRELTVPGTRHSAVLRDLRPGTLYSLTLYGLRGPHKADSVQGSARTLSPSKAPHWAHTHAPQSEGSFYIMG